VEKYCRAVQATDHIIRVMWRMCVALCITKTTNIHSECVILLSFFLQQCFVCRVRGNHYLVLLSVCVCACRLPKVDCVLQEHVVVQLFEALHYKPEGPRFDSQWSLEFLILK
jgi:hypothetical protein